MEFCMPSLCRILRLLTKKIISNVVCFGVSSVVCSLVYAHDIFLLPNISPAEILVGEAMHLKQPPNKTQNDDSFIAAADHFKAMESNLKEVMAGLYKEKRLKEMLVNYIKQELKLDIDMDIEEALLWEKFTDMTQGICIEPSSTKQILDELLSYKSDISNPALQLYSQDLESLIRILDSNKTKLIKAEATNLKIVIYTLKTMFECPRQEVDHTIIQLSAKLAEYERSYYDLLQFNESIRDISYRSFVTNTLYPKIHVHHNAPYLNQKKDNLRMDAQKRSVLDVCTAGGLEFESHTRESFNPWFDFFLKK